MKRRTLVKLSSLFAVTSIFSASVSTVGIGRVDAQQQCRRVDPKFSSCARQIAAVFRRYRLKVNSFDIQYADRNGNCYQYASNRASNKSMEKDEQPSLLSPTSIETYPTFDDSKRIVAQGQSLAEQVLNNVQDAMTKEGVSLISAQVDSYDAYGNPCRFNTYLGIERYAEP
jgi:hypothetical protein